MGRVRIDRIKPSGPFYSRVGYRCAHREWDPEAGKWVERRHRFTDRTADDPLPRRHPTHEHPFHKDSCALCETTFAPDAGMRAGRHFFFAAHDIANHLAAVAKGGPITRSIADVRRDAVRYRARTRSHLPDPEAEPPVSETPAVEPDWADAPLDEWDFEPEAVEADEPAWLEDAPRAAREPRRRSRGWVERVRVERGEIGLADALPTPAEMVGKDQFISRSFALGAQYVDVFGPTVCAPFRREIWPDAIILDSVPLNRRINAVTPSEMRVARTERDFLCEVFGVRDAANHELILLYPAGSKDRESVKEVFGQMRGQPTWIVTDGDAGIAAAIAETFGPATIHYRCEDHLRKDALDAADRDGIEDPNVLHAIGRAQRSPEAWAILRRTVEQRAPAAFRLSKWIAANEDLVLDQIEIRRANPGRPFSTGALEGDLVIVREALDRRRVTLRNRRRLVTVLDLLRVGRANHVRPEEFRTLVRAQLEGTRDTAIPWKEHWDHWDRRPDRIIRRNSIIEFRDIARARNAVLRADQDNQASLVRVQRSYAAAKAEAATAGGILPQPVERARDWPPEARPGDRVADVPELLAIWDFERNAADGLDPSVVAARSRDLCHWVCRAHEQGDPLGRWPGHLHRWTQTPENRLRSATRCRFCGQSDVCPRHSLRTTHPNLADPAVWDYATNDANGITPDNTSHGRHGKVSWLCPHGSFEAEIRVRVRGHGCKRCADEVSAQRSRNAANRNAKARRAEAKRIREGQARGPGTVLPFEPRD